MISLTFWILVFATFVTIAAILISGGVGSLRGGAAFIAAVWLIVLAMYPLGRVTTQDRPADWDWF